MDHEAKALSDVKRPNILWVVTTQWRAQATGYAGDPNARTPALDALAAEAINFTEAVTPHPFGPFARAALLTGVASPENGVRDYFDALPLEARTIAHDLEERGYSTAFFGKWHLGKRDPAAALVGEAHAKSVVSSEARGGFEFWEGFESGFLLNDPWLQGTRLPEPVRFPGYQSDVVCGRAADWIGATLEVSREQNGEGKNAKEDVRSAEAAGAGGKPWFCVVSLEAPHPPYDAPAAGVAVRRAEDIILPANVPRGGDVETKARRELAGYYAHIEATDRAIGELMASVRTSAPGVWDDTLVVFTSMHGDMHGAHGLFRKGWPYEESVRVPLLVKLPGKLVVGEGSREGAKGSKAARSEEAGERRGDAVSLVDLRGMILGFSEGAGLAAREVRAAEGVVSLAGVARISMPSVVALPHQCDRVWRGVRTGKRKLILNADGSPWLFFDLENDPGELRNLAGEPEWAEEIKEMARRV